MQKRIPVATADTFEEAHEVKESLCAGFPDKTFQIRRKSRKFVVVERVTTSKATEIQHTNAPKRRKKRGISF